MIHTILFQPEIPQNTGNIGRLCAITRSRLHLIHPLGFRIDERAIRRSGMDYWAELDYCEHRDWEAFVAAKNRPKRVWLFTTHARGQPFWDADFQDGDGLLFGNEGAGSPDYVHDWVGAERRICIPQMHPNLRSLNLSTSVGIAVYEALRQIRLA